MSPSAFARPSAFLPLLMSLAALVLVVCHVVFFGTTREADEGAAAHTFQLLIAGQAPVIAFFAVKWLQRAPPQALVVLSSQALAIVVAFAPVWYFGL